jgi:hypothetical protein
MEDLNAVVQQVVQVSPIMKVFRIAPVGWELPEFRSVRSYRIATNQCKMSGGYRRTCRAGSRQTD